MLNFWLRVFSCFHDCAVFILCCSIHASMQNCAFSFAMWTRIDIWYDDIDDGKLQLILFRVKKLIKLTRVLSHNWVGKSRKVSFAVHYECFLRRLTSCDCYLTISKPLPILFLLLVCRPNNCFFLLFFSCFGIITSYCWIHLNVDSRGLDKTFLLCVHKPRGSFLHCGFAIIW